mgnify:CR=1 FL=1
MVPLNFSLACLNRSRSQDAQPGAAARHCNCWVQAQVGSASVRLEAEVVDEAEHAVVEEHDNITGRDRLLLREDELFHVVEGPIQDD